MSALPLLCTAQSVTPPPVAVARPQNLHASGTVSAYDAKGLTVLEPITGSMTVYLTNANTSFVDTHDRFVSPDLIAQQISVKVHYTQTGNTLLATKVVVNTTLNTEGTLIEVSPGVVVIQLSGAPATPVHFVSNKELKFVNHKGASVKPQEVKLGAQVRVFYSKTGDTLVASQVEMR
ncbi:DUF5666 domain-containing protein [Prosthecobacter sp.]|uniref:DUF5666 domain-containing protein n=1 Tax=Prosthecobacter sp. TaxID=1965333 RepID=UPI002486F2A2|nr:DUF5666 domain-containing protein [Prosthecobacter sp.]MDI1312274.1 DUF5666 domain-containing protein [Prosthecobacter sp.]